jgi:hypothetical protein
MAILQDIVDALTPKATTSEATVETQVIQDPITKPFPANILRNDIAWETAITGETEAVIHSED